MRAHLAYLRADWRLVAAGSLIVAIMLGGVIAGAAIAAGGPSLWQ